MAVTAAGCLLAAALAGPVLEWPGHDGARTAQVVNADGTRTAPVLTDDPELRRRVLRLDGRQLLTLRHQWCGDQTVRVLVRYPGRPAGALVSRSRFETGMRGFELGFVGRKAFEFDGDRMALNLSDGTRERTKYRLGDRVGVGAGGWLEWVLRFQGGKALRLDIFRRDTGVRIGGVELEADGISALSARAGEGLLCIGGRRQNSKLCAFTAPAGTLLGGVTVWNARLSDAELGKALGVAAVSAGPSGVPAVRYVDALRGSDANDGLSPDRALASLQSAAASVGPGDTVIVAPGVYYGPVELRHGGTAAAPIVFRAGGTVPGGAVITGADRAIREGRVKWRVEDRDRRIYSIPLGHQPVRVLYDGIDLFGGYLDPDGLRTLTLKDGYPGPQRGYCFDAGQKRLYVRLPEGESALPEKFTWAVGPVSAPGSNGHHVGRPEDADFFIAAGKSAHVILEGFTFETPGAAGVLSTSGEVAVRDCFFRGCRFGVWGTRGARGFFVENCDYGQSPVFGDFQEILKRCGGTAVAEKFRFYFWAHKGKSTDNGRFKNYETGIIGGAIVDAHVRNCLIDDSFEGISTWCVSSMKQLRVYGNVFRRIIDNAVETENHACDVRIHDNLFEDVTEAISWQPLCGKPWPGPVFVYRNVFRDTALTTACQPFSPGVFKLGASGQNWTYPHMGGLSVAQLEGRESKRFVVVPDPGFLVFNNTVIRPRGSLVGTPQPILGPAARELVNFRFFNNILDTEHFHARPEWRGSLLEFFRNVVVGMSSADPHFAVETAGRGMTVPTLAALGLPASGVGLPAAKSPAAGRGTLAFQETDASTDPGVFAHDAPPPPSDWPGKVGPGKSVVLAQLSPFRRRLHFQPGVLRAAGPEYGTWGVYAPETPLTVELSVPKGGAGRVEVRFRAAAPDGRHPLLTAGPLGVVLTVTGGEAGLSFGRGGKHASLPLGRLSRAVWQRLVLSRAADGALAVSLNGKSLGSPAETSWPSGASWRVTVGAVPVFDCETGAVPSP